ncbi:response regulator transcription factor [Streptomyces lydicus]|uniref:response regulator transcription factor n=1 Tax=Streptomyces lydicus TaxID=47763 RepID=UPI0036F5D8F6
MRVLLIEDDNAIAEPLVEGLRRYGFAIDRVGTGAAGLAAPAPDMVLLDLGLPDMDGIDVCRTLRGRSRVPIIMITARGDETDRVVGLELGADDYLSKPFGIRELVARMRAVTRRARLTDSDSPGMPAADETGSTGSTPQRIGDLLIDRRTRKVHVAGAQVALAPKEFDLLTLLAEDPGAVYSRQHILDTVWDPNYFGPSKTLDVHIAALRRKLGNPTWIETVRGVGFRLTVSADGGEHRR